MATDFTFSGELSYSSTSTANFSFQISRPATGFSNTFFGIATIPLSSAGVTTTQFGTPEQAFHATGFSSTVVSPQVYYPHLLTETATGTQVTQWGATGSYALVTCSATGFAASITFGTTTGTQFWWARQWWPQTQFGQVFTASPQTATAIGKELTQKWGVTYGIKQVIYDADYTIPAESLGKVTLFGTPNRVEDSTKAATGTSFAPSFGTAAIAPRNFTAEATSINTTGYGTPLGVLVTFAEGLAPSTVLGDHRLITGVKRATGVSTTTFGFSAAERTRNASSITRRIRFGTPRSSKTRDFKQWPINSRAHFGRPQYLPSYPTTTGFCSTTVSIPYSVPTYPGWSVSPDMHFGTPLLKRTLQC